VEAGLGSASGEPGACLFHKRGEATPALHGLRPMRSCGRQLAALVQEDLNRAARPGRGQATGTSTGPGLTDEDGEDSVGVTETVGPGPGRAERVGMRLAAVAQPADGARLSSRKPCCPVFSCRSSSSLSATPVHASRPGSWRRSGDGGRRGDGWHLFVRRCGSTSTRPVESILRKLSVGATTSRPRCDTPPTRSPMR